MTVQPICHAVRFALVVVRRVIFIVNRFSVTFKVTST